jgi:uncharacterized protein
MIALKMAIVLVAIWIFLRWFERANLYFPDRTITATPRSYGMAFEEVWLKTSDNVKIYGWYVPATRRGGAPSPPAVSSQSESIRGQALPPYFLKEECQPRATHPGQGRGPAPTVLFCHGNAGNISHRMDKMALLHELGLNVFIFDYRGYGNSGGRPSEVGTYRDAEAAYNWLVEREASSAPLARREPGEGIILYGESLGCAVAVETAKNHPVSAVILESAFTSTVDMAKRILPWLPARAIIRYRYDTLAKIAPIKAPVLLLHSRQDEIVPFSMAQALFTRAAGPKRLVELTGSHNEGFLESGSCYSSAIQDFLKSVSPAINDSIAPQ